MRVALLLFGQCLAPRRDWRFTFLGIRERIVEEFEREGYVVDVFYATNDDIKPLEREQLERTWAPIRCAYLSDAQTSTESRNRKVARVTSLCLRSGIPYTQVVLTRFDLAPRIPLRSHVLLPNAFNVVSTLEREELICDNLYVMPHSLLRAFNRIVRQTVHVCSHKLRARLEARAPLHFIRDERRCVSRLSFYGLHRT